MHGQSMMNTIMAKDEIVGSGHKLMSFIMGKSKTTCPTRTRHKVRSLGGVGFGKYIPPQHFYSGDSTRKGGTRGTRCRRGPVKRSERIICRPKLLRLYTNTGNSSTERTERSQHIPCVEVRTDGSAPAWPSALLRNELRSTGHAITPHARLSKEGGFVAAAVAGVSRPWPPGARGAWRATARRRAA